MKSGFNYRESDLKIYAITHYSCTGKIMIFARGKMKENIAYVRALESPTPQVEEESLRDQQV
jgi:hypothetical protein